MASRREAPLPMRQRRAPRERSASETMVKEPPTPAEADKMVKEPPTPAEAEKMVKEPPTPAEAETMVKDPPTPAEAETMVKEPPTPAEAEKMVKEPPTPAEAETMVKEPPTPAEAETMVKEPPTPAEAETMVKEPPTPAEVEKMRAPVVPPVVYVRNDGSDGGNGGGGAVGGSGDDFHLTARADETGREKKSEGSVCLERRDIFLFNIESETTEDDIKQFMATTDVKCMEVECRSNQDARNKSFRVQIGEADYEKTMNADNLCGLQMLALDHI